MSEAAMISDTEKTRIIAVAANRVCFQFRNVPGCINDRDDYKQEAVLALLKLSSERLAQDRNGNLIYFIARRRMIDAARQQMIMTRAEYRSGGDTRVFFPVEWTGEEDLRAKQLSPLDILIVKERLARVR